MRSPSSTRALRPSSSVRGEEVTTVRTNGCRSPRSSATAGPSSSSHGWCPTGSADAGFTLPDPAPMTRTLWRRVLLGAVLVVFASATATALAGFREIDRVVAAFRDGRVLDLGKSLSESESGEPQTLMLLGSDARPAWSPNHEEKTRSDTVILLRFDPEQGATTMLSLPRDLKVQVPGVGARKLNAAYEAGGPRLALETVKQLTGLRINHVINVDSAGYQRMCGKDSLDYVRYRHEDNDLLRGARQQGFLREVKQQVSVGDLISDRQRLIEIFGRYTSSEDRKS